MTFLTQAKEAIKEFVAFDEIKDVLQLAIFNTLSKGYNHDEVKRMLDAKIHAKNWVYRDSSG